jgi:hypothetical protein
MAFVARQQRMLVILHSDQGCQIITHIAWPAYARLWDSTDTAPFGSILKSFWNYE